MKADLQSGMMVTLKRQYHENTSEVFKLSQAEGNRAWAGDIDGRGWYVHDYQIDRILEQNEDVVEDCNECNGACFVPTNVEDGKRTIWIVCPECNGDGGEGSL